VIHVFSVVSLSAATCCHSSRRRLARSVSTTTVVKGSQLALMRPDLGYGLVDRKLAVILRWIMAFFSLAARLPSGTIASLAATVFTIRANLAAHRHLRLFHASAIAPVVVTVRAVLLPLFGAEVLAPLSIRSAVAPVGVTVRAVLLPLFGAEVLAPLTTRFALVPVGVTVRAVLLPLFGAGVPPPLIIRFSVAPAVTSRRPTPKASSTGLPLVIRNVSMYIRRIYTKENPA
jgi:hypothetical protein